MALLYTLSAVRYFLSKLQIHFFMYCCKVPLEFHQIYYHYYYAINYNFRFDPNEKKK